tara:strand:+ start:1976 stop:2212 length:237 start_codon:yes stop_codon:yes gene_type:complete
MLITLAVKENKIKSMSKAKKKAAPKKKVQPKKLVTKKVEVKPAEVKPVEVKAAPSHIEIPYKPRRIDRLPPDLNKLKK